MNSICFDVKLFLIMILSIFNIVTQDHDESSPVQSESNSWTDQEHYNQETLLKNAEDDLKYDNEELIIKLNDILMSFEINRYDFIFESFLYEGNEITFDSFKELSAIEIYMNLIYFYRALCKGIRDHVDLIILYKISSDFVYIFYTSILLKSNDILKNSFLYETIEKMSMSINRLYHHHTLGYMLLYDIEESVEELNKYYKLYKNLSDTDNPRSEQIEYAKHEYNISVDLAEFIKDYNGFLINSIQNKTVDEQKLAVLKRLQIRLH